MLDGVACNMWNPVAGREQLAHSFPKQAWFVPSTFETYYDLLGPVGCGLLYLLRKVPAEVFGAKG